MKPSENREWLDVPGWLTTEEADALYDAALTSTSIIDVGTAMGRSAIALALSGKSVTTIDYNRDRVTECDMWANRCAVTLQAIIGDSRQAAKQWQGPVDLLFIDGWHDAANVRADYAAWAPHVIPGGSIWFHDAYGAGWPDVHVLIDELVASEALVLDGYVGTIAKCRKGAANG